MPLSAKASQEFLPIKEIRDGVVILKDDSLRLVLMTSSLNFALKSLDEQEALIMQYQNFLNSIDFHIQIFIQSRKLDIRPYVVSLEGMLKEQTNELIKIQTSEYIEFIKKFTESANIMTKTFFIVIPFTPTIATNSGSRFSLPIFGKKTNTQVKLDFEESRTQLEARASVVEQGLNRIVIRTAALGTEELIELFYKLFNPGEIGAPTAYQVPEGESAYSKVSG
ncbi:MAG: hypothetical protein WCO03_00810 [bacterium]